MLGGDVPKVEFKANLLDIGGLFTSADLTPYEDSLPGLAHSVARCWEALARHQFPGCDFTVEVYDDGSAPIGPEITLCTS